MPVVLLTMLVIWLFERYGLEARFRIYLKTKFELYIWSLIHSINLCCESNVVISKGSVEKVCPFALIAFS